MIRAKTSHPAYLLGMLLINLACAGCVVRPTPSAPVPVATVSEDTPLSKFIVGKWSYYGKSYYPGYGYADIYLEYTFQPDNVLLIWHADEPGFRATGGDGVTCTYQLQESDIVQVDCPRNAEQEQWSVKRDGQYLLVQRLDQNPTFGLREELRFTRMAGI